MNVKSISEKEALSLSEREESHFFDRKAMEVSGKKVQKIAVALANADGGEFLIGVADDKDQPDPNARWNGVSKIEELNSHLQNLFDVKPSLDLRYEILTCENKPGYVLRVLIEKGSSLHRTTGGTVYQRHGAQSLPIKDPQRIMELSFAKGATSFEDQVIKGLPPEAVVESEEIMRFLSEYSPATHPLDFATNQNLLDPQSWEPRAAGVLLFNDNPSASIPRKCAVKIARYETRELDPERDHLAEQHSVEAPLFQQITRSIEITSHITVHSLKWF